MNKVETIREWVKCPQFGDNHYGELGALPYHKRKILKDLCDYVEPLEKHDLEITKAYIELQKRIDKAIECIEKNKLNGNKISEMLCGSEIITLLEILKGENLDD